MNNLLNRSKRSAAALVGLVCLTASLGASLGTSMRSGRPHDLLATIPKFVDPLPIPPRIVAPPAGDITIELVQTAVKMHSAIAATPVFAYNGSLPGPTIEVESGQALRVHWLNHLPSKHVLAAAKSGMEMGLPDVKSVTHLHGAVVAQPSLTDKVHDNDGWPDLFTVPGEEQIAKYPNQQDARLMWYHDHAMGDTGRNVAAGLAGLYIIRDAYERSLNLPSGEFEIPLVLQTQGFNGNGTRYYTNDLVNEFYGNAATVNGKLWPYLTVQPRKYRFRIVNAANARTFALRLLDNSSGVIGPAIAQIGSDSGFLQDTVILNDPSLKDPMRLTLAPAERADIIVDFSQYAGRTLLLQNNSLDVGDASEIPLPQIMQIRVAASRVSETAGASVSSDAALARRELGVHDDSSLPMHPKPIERMQESTATTTRKIVIDSMNMADGRPMLMLNGLGWHDAVTEQPVVNSTEIWEIVNLQPDTHPFHIHLVQFQVLNRVPFDVAEFRKSGQYVFTGPPEPPDANEMGWKDVVRSTPRHVTRIIMKFAPYTGHYVYHCHILEHEDMDMMRPFDVVP
jgi:spore coat protein A